MKSIKAQIAVLPDEPGIYKFYDDEGKLLYVGKSVSLKKRVSSYFANKNLGPKTDLLVKKIRSIDHIKVFSEFEALLLEAELIREHKPFFNIEAKDDKSPIYIKITNDPIPLVTLVRKEKPSRKNFVVGPFPSIKVTKEILRIIRRIFPYCHHKNPKKPCLYVHLGLCPYPYQSEEAKAEYFKNIRRIKKLLKGNIKSLIRDLTHEMTAYAKAQQFEKAQDIKKKIERLQYLTTTYHAPQEFLQNPALVDDLSLTRLKDLQEVLELPKIPKRIECYDIANISGKLATGSMVVFVNGKVAKDQYRRFKIKFTHKPNDYEMHREVLARRFKNDWPLADVMIIDGGRGQLNAALSIAIKYKIKSVKIIGLAKRLEEIYTQDKVLPISLPKESPARQLVQALRDEAHRFANTYHRLLRSKDMISK
ncbi:MAG: GIY-YIG nuclease family protein [Candidatus Curtissbacteria bacterium]|nr:GIY-YIG nuclease family protein [Candidatus Curtissbacteria bacterium]